MNYLNEEEEEGYELTDSNPQVQEARDMAEAPDVYDVQNRAPMLYLWQVEDLLSKPLD